MGAAKERATAAGVSAYGFGGTNFPLVIEEHVPGMLKPEPKVYAAAVANGGQVLPLHLVRRVPASRPARNRLRGILAASAKTPAELKDRLDDLFRRVEAGWAPERQYRPWLISPLPSGSSSTSAATTGVARERITKGAQGGRL